MAVLKLVKTLFYTFCILVILLCAGVIGLACSPSATDKLADMLYGENRDSGVLDVLDRQEESSQDSSTEGDGTGQASPSGEDQEQTPETPAPATEPPRMDEPLTWQPKNTPQPVQSQETVSTPDFDTNGMVINIYAVKNGSTSEHAASYIIPSSDSVTAPKDLADRVGYTPVTDETTELNAEEAEKLRLELSLGETGTALYFDSLYYPYYYLLDETGQAIYRQIYANANSMNKTFLPCQDITVNALKTVFEAVYNDHPELFWLETGYNCRYSRSGQCVEISLKFSITEEELPEFRSTFETQANRILNQAWNLADDYEKEKYIHNRLLELVEYQSGAAMSQSAYSALVNGKTVCAGYARAFQYLMQQMGIPCYYCTGYSGENHAWNIIYLYGEYYNVDLTWDDTEPATYLYFNKTDEDYKSTHARRGLAQKLPACNGSTYRNLEPEPAGVTPSPSPSPVPQTTPTPSSTPAPQNNISPELEEYYQDCGQRIINNGLGSSTFVQEIDAGLWAELWEAYNNGNISDSFLIRAMNRLGGSSCSVQIVCQEAANGKYRLTHTVNIY
ncbi:MAG: hypothetical protein K2H45_02355 [Acetatifactor sp.]|nr:hypothetical protein [Acetatifactor sp.]